LGIEKCKIIDLPKITDPRGNLTFIQPEQHIPFEIRRVFYIYDVPTGETRGAHANKTLQEFVICLSGSFDVYLDDGRDKKTFHLNRPWQGLYIPPMIWGWEGNYDPGSVCLVLASTLYDHEDYFYDYNDYLIALQKGP
jgi:dTDP-4-dehydrorhamnose 3,5-epimerase-like enzyme